MKTARPVASDQLGFGFEEPNPAPVSSAKPPAKRISPAAPAASAVVAAPAQKAFNTPPVSAAAEGSAEAMARALEAHPDYRVLRRLVPRLVFPAATGPVATLLVLDTETTGLNAARDKVVELALLRVTVDLATGAPVGAVPVSYTHLTLPTKRIV